MLLLIIVFRCKIKKIKKKKKGFSYWKVNFECSKNIEMKIVKTSQQALVLLHQHYSTLMTLIEKCSPLIAILQASTGALFFLFFFKGANPTFF